MDLSKHQFAVSCPSCGWKFKQRLARLRSDPTFVCPGCKQPFAVDTAGLRAKMTKVWDAIANVAVAFKRIGNKR